MSGKDDLLREIPDWVANAPGFQALFGAIGSALDNFRGNRQDVYEQLFIVSSTWALQFWENELALQFDPSLTTDQRRQRILGRFRSRQTPTPKAVRAMANSFQNGDVETYMDWENYTLYVRFVDVRGVPPNISELQDQITKMVDANLQVVFQFRYLTVGELAQWGNSISALQNFHLTVRQLLTWVPVTLQHAITSQAARFKLRSQTVINTNAGLRFSLIAVQNNWRHAAARFALRSTTTFRNLAVRFGVTAAHQPIYWGAWVDYAASGVTPNAGSYGGGGTVAGSALATFESHAGKQVSLAHFNNGSWMSNGSYQAFNSVNADRTIQAGRLAHVEWFPWDQSDPNGSYALRPAAIARGDHDTYITQWATDCKNWGGPLVIRMGSEMNASWLDAWPWSCGVNGSATVHFGSNNIQSITSDGTKWTVTTTTTPNPRWDVGGTVTIAGATVTGYNGVFTIATVVSTGVFTITNATVIASAGVGGTATHTWTNTEADYINYFRHVGDIFRSVGCTNGKLFWCVNVRDATQHPYANYYPGYDSNGRAYADWIGWDGYPFFGNTFLQSWRAGQTTVDTYAEIGALDPNLPMMVGECGYPGRRGNPMAITSLTASGTQLSVVVPSSPGGGGWQATQGLVIDSANPSQYNGSYTITSVTGTGPYTLTVASTATGAFVSGNASMIDRILRATLIKSDLETNVPAMPRIKALQFFWVNYADNLWSFDYAGTSDQAGNIDMVAFKKAIGNAHYLAGNVMGTNLDPLPFVPFENQSLTDKYQEAVKSTAGLEVLLMLNDASGSATVSDISGHARNGTVNGAIGLGTAGSIPAYPSLTSTSYPGASGNNVQLNDIDAWSVLTTNALSVELWFYMPSLPTAQEVFASKGNFTGGNNYEWLFYADGTTIGFSLNQASGATYAANTNPIPPAGRWHHVVCVSDLSLSAPISMWIDGVIQSNGSTVTGSLINGTAPVLIGQRGDSFLSFSPMQSGHRIAAVAIYSTPLTQESILAHYSLGH